MTGKNGKKRLENGVDAHSYGAGFNGEEVHLRDYLTIVRKHRWLVAAAFMVIVTTAAIKSFSATPVYSSTTTIKIDREPPKVLKFEDVLPIETHSYDFYETQHRIIQSRAIARKVIDRLSLWRHPQFQRKQEPGEAGADVTLDMAAMDRMVESVLTAIRVEMVRNSRLARITFSSPDPELAARVADQVAQSYIDFNLESKYMATEKARGWLSGQMKEFQAKVEESEEALYAFSREQGIFSLEKDENLVTRRLEEMNEALSAAESDRITRESFYKEVSRFSPRNIPGTHDGDLQLIDGLKREYSMLEAEYIKLSNLYKPGYPKLLRLKAQMDTVEAGIDRESENLVKRAEVAYMISLERENLLRDAVERQKELALQMKESAIQYNILKREVDTNKELYDGLLQRVKETGVSAGLESSNVQVVDRAVVPVYPSRPDKRRNILLSMVMGLFVGVGLAFFREYFDNTVKDPDAVTRLVNLPTLGLIPSLQSTVARKRGRKDNDGSGSKEPPPSEDGLYLVSQRHPRSSISEACRTFRTSLLFSTPGHPPKTILVTSNNPREGKTFISCNLGIVLAQGGARTLIVDADLRRPSCHKAFDVSNSSGLTDYLTGHSSLRDVIIPTHVDGLSVLPAGPLSPNPPELLDSALLSRAIEELKADFDFIVFDSAPVMHFADTLNLANKVEGTVLVTNSAKTTRDDLKHAVGLMNGVNATVLGVVMNIVDIRKSDYYHNYYYYSYGEGTEKRVGTTAT